ncbi:hypothetical protein ASE75_09620 [Sphingomonas sp. Leaf17]|uniref:GNAT family N-acetyltransferase n=1 Tax=Sphingomonas sp. Leaf17 TaxID=1735683 RepID=UPI0006FB9E2A|nr:GNAT family N-acetyltransferase [Sphingomonas sp. Leaf17]KQM64241.1 hypothetical protein ASE75_09620 [Sphingomonas sp. Leaf17]
MTAIRPAIDPAIPGTPTIVTDRLTLSPYGPADLDDYAAMLADPVVCRHVGGRTFTREETWHRILRYIGHWQVVGHGNWAVRDTATGRYLGDVGLMDSRRATDPGYEGTLEAGWMFTTAAQGRGIAGEAVAAMLGWADGQGMARTVCIIAPGNAASIRLATRMGYALVAAGTYKAEPTLVFERPRRSGSVA